MHAVGHHSQDSNIKSSFIHLQKYLSSRINATWINRHSTKDTSQCSTDNRRSGSISSRGNTYYSTDSETFSSSSASWEAGGLSDSRGDCLGRGISIVGKKTEWSSSLGSTEAEDAERPVVLLGVGWVGQCLL
jgi:hypothetical protein